MQGHLDEPTFDAHDDLMQCGAQDPLAGFRRRGRVRPSELQIGTELHQVPPLFLPERCWPFRLELSNLALEPMHDLQRLIPAALELASHKTIVGINSIILPPGICRREPGLLQRQLELPSCGGYLALLSRQRLDRGSMPSGFNTRSTSVTTASSARKPPNEMHRAVP